ncbi:MAG: DNA primase [Clostridia bacterium]|nr:DNA primase [Clostridia bacterium]
MRLYIGNDRQICHGDVSGDFHSKSVAQMMIPREIIEEIVYRTDISDLIGSYVTLKRAGSNMNGLCPFHSERTPSFTVFPNTKSFYCFGCGAGGDAITFVMRAENLDYPSAVEVLATRAGVSIPQDRSEADAGVSRKRIYEMNLAAAKFFRQCLFDKQIGAEALRYLTEKRKLSMTTIKRFGLGFSPNNFGALTTHLKGLGFTDEELIAGFLCGKSQKTGRPYDYFRNRVIFPIIDVTGNVIAFGGRVMDDSKPKYLNSSDTPGFKKSKNLFAMNYAKNHCSEQLILCEGYMDVIALHEAGFENSVATLGTAITAEQARMMTKYTKKVVLLYDSDKAGQNATERALRLLSEVGLDTRVLNLNDAKDPDEYIKKFGAARFRALMGESRTGFDFKMSRALEGFDLQIPDDKIKASQALCQIISESYSAVEREVFIMKASEKLGLPVEVLRNNVEQMIRKRVAEQKRGESQNAQMSIKNIGDRINPDAVKFAQANVIEENILGLLLIYDEHRQAVASGKIQLSENDFLTSFGKKVFSAIMELQSDKAEFLSALLGEKFSAEEMGRIEKMKQNRLALTENGFAVLESAAAALVAERERVQAAESGDKFSALRAKQEKLKQMKTQK